MLEQITVGLFSSISQVERLLFSGRKPKKAQSSHEVPAGQKLESAAAHYEVQSK